MVAIVAISSRILPSAEILNNQIHHNWTSSSARAMGNTFMLVNDPNILFYHPAALVYYPAGEMSFNLVAGEIQLGDESILGLVDDITKATKVPKDDQTQAMIDVLKNTYHDYYHARVKGPNFLWTRPNWGFAFNPVDLTVGLAPKRGLGPILDLFLLQDSTISYGRGHLINKIPGLSVGWLLKTVHRISYDERFSIDTLVSNGGIKTENLKDDVGRGLTVDADISAHYLLPYELSWAKISVGGAIRNVFDYGFPWMKEKTEPIKLGRRFDLGTRFDFPVYKVFRTSAALEMRDINDENWSWIKGFRFGSQLEILGWWWLKAALKFGVNQGYFSYGLDWNLLIFRLEFTSFGEEIGTSSSPKENRVYLGQVSFNF